MIQVGFRLRLVMALVIALLVLPLLTFHLVSDQAYRQALQGVLASQGLTMEVTRLGTCFPIGLAATNLTLNSSSDPWIRFEQINVKLRLLPLLFGKVRCSTKARIGTGTISGEILLFPRKQQAASLVIDRLQLSDIAGVTSRLGSQTKGAVRLDLKLARQGATVQGESKIQISAIHLKEAQLGGMRLPDLTVPEARGFLKISGQMVTIESLALQGEGIYLRLKGTCPASIIAPVNLTLELLPTAEFLERQKIIFLLMLPYQTSPGCYSLPIGGTFEKPQIRSLNVAQ